MAPAAGATPPRPLGYPVAYLLRRDLLRPLVVGVGRRFGSGGGAAVEGTGEESGVGVAESPFFQTIGLRWVAAPLLLGSGEKIFKHDLLLNICITTHKKDYFFLSKR